MSQENPDQNLNPNPLDQLAARLDELSADVRDAVTLDREWREALPDTSVSLLDDERNRLSVISRLIARTSTPSPGTADVLKHILLFPPQVARDSSRNVRLLRDWQARNDPIASAGYSYFATNVVRISVSRLAEDDWI